MMTVDELRAFVEATGWTVAEAADRLGVTREHLSKVLAGKNPVSRSLDKKVKAAAAHAVASLSQFMDEK